MTLVSQNPQPRNHLGQFIENFDDQLRIDVSSSDNKSSSSLSSSDSLDQSDNSQRIPLFHPAHPVQIMAYNLNPFDGDINPSNADGQKNFLKCTEERKDDKKLKIDQTSAKRIMTAFESDARKFGWGSLVNIVPFNDAGGTHSISATLQKLNSTKLGNRLELRGAATRLVLMWLFPQT